MAEIYNAGSGVQNDDMVFYSNFYTGRVASKTKGGWTGHRVTAANPPKADE